MLDVTKNGLRNKTAPIKSDGKDLNHQVSKRAISSLFWNIVRQQNNNELQKRQGRQPSVFSYMIDVRQLQNTLNTSVYKVPV